ncbi:MmcQ/YjbR family DNA-binding protein [Rhizobium calliandrae]|uniref:MmcQ/YjbR family DNA-binding protein n=1 Tax=Rhizobium calliandrae TaxID=1312182 RepID=A0ABT7KGF9_9HYPH|nr:MmcQ/YjbR family DNA-binding protein [Rhizobium calliandrae]MDL2407712.1 MmcQ/YjbR family DNA-binding protein [Rhizobium calliandrae]
MSTDTDAISQRLQRIAAKARLREVEVSTHYGTPALKVGGKAFVSIKNDETIVLALPIDRKEQLIEMAPEIYFQSDHYVGWPSLPLRIAAIGDDELQLRLIEAWLFRAPKKLRTAFDAS